MLSCCARSERQQLRTELQRNAHLGDRTMALTFFSVIDPFAKPGNNTQVFGINATGQIVGGYVDNLSKEHGFLYTAGTYVTLDVPGATFTEAFGINSSGQIVGTFFDKNFNEHSFLFSNGDFTKIDNPNPAATLTEARGIDSSGNIVGFFFDQTGSHAFVRLANGGFFRTDPPGATSALGAAINDTGQIVGEFLNNAGLHGYVQINGEFTPLDDPVANASSTVAEEVNNAGQVVGFYQLGSNLHGFLYSGGTNGQFTTTDRPGAAGEQLFNSNDSGELGRISAVGGFLAETIPASGSTAIFGTAFNAPISGEFNNDALSDLVWRRPSDGLTENQYLSGS